MLFERQSERKASRATIPRAMPALGFSPLRLLRRARGRDAARLACREQQEFPAIAAQAKRVGARVFSSDDGGMRSDDHAGTTWAPIECTPTVSTTQQRFSVNMLSPVSPDGQMPFMLYDGPVTAKLFVEFLERLLPDIDGQIFLVLDNLGVHKAKLVQALVAAQHGRLKLFRLPLPSYPNLNPDEQVWGNVKTRVAKQTLTDKPTLIEQLTDALHRLCTLRRTVAGSFYPQCRYILGAMDFT